MLLFREDKRFLSQRISRHRFLSMGALTLFSGVAPRLCFAAMNTLKDALSAPYGIHPQKIRYQFNRFFNAYTG